MLARIAWFEIRYQIRQPLFWIAFVLYFFFTFMAITTDAVQIGGSIGSVNRNAPYVIMQILLVMTVLGTFLTTAFVSTSVHRDYETRADAIFFSLPLRKSDYLFGRFLGALVVALLVYMGVVAGVIVGSRMPWLEAERVGPFLATPYVYGTLAFVIPNLLIFGALFFAIATLTRSLMYTYSGVVVLFMGWGISRLLLQDLDDRWYAALIDPFGGAAFRLVSRYWTVAEKNTGLSPFTGELLASRLAWLALGGLALGLTWARFAFSAEGAGRERRATATDDVPAPARPAAPATAIQATQAAAAPATQVFGTATSWRQFLRLVRMEATGAVRGVPFIIMLMFGLLNFVISIGLLERIYGTPVHPVTYLIIEAIDGTFGLFAFLILVFYAGDMIWRDRNLRLSEMVDALPVPTWVFWASKLAALVVLLVVMLGATMVVGIGVQASRGFVHPDILLYLKGLFLVQGIPYLFLAALCVFLQVVLNQKFTGWIAATVIYLASELSPLVRLEHHLYRFGSAPESPYSDMNQYGHFVQPLLWFYLYWGCVSVILVGVAHLLWIRGTEPGRAMRLRIARGRLTAPATAFMALALGGALATGGYVFYNTNILNHYLPTKTRLDRMAEFEKKYRQYENLEHPRITDVQADVDIRPAERSVDVRGHYTLRNKTDKPIPVLHLYLSPEMTVRRLEIPGARLEMEDKDYGYRIYRFDQPMAPGATLLVSFDLTRSYHGFVNNGAPTDLVYNGTFFTNLDYFPHIGYSKQLELDDPNERRRRGLPPVQRLPKLDDATARMSNYLTSEADWVHYDTTVSTSSDQIALAPGYLQREWTENGRRYFHYSMDAPILDYFAYLSARWVVKRDSWNGVAIEVYYHPGHTYNVDRMIDATKKSLDYFTKNFGPYQYRQVRILEFPRYASFAESFPNTIPFSESIGFIARLDDKPDSIDYVFYVTAHEVAHQWWAHQVMGGNVQGCTLLSETMAQYSALMVMEKEYGRDTMRRFLRYELDRYLSGRGTERIEELPLMLVENQQYIHYRKGSLAMYALRDYVGEEPLNRALAAYVAAVKFQEPPYTYTREFLDYVKQAVPADRQSILDDLFRNITLYDNRAKVASWTKRDDGKYVVSLQVTAAKFRADGQGKETAETLDDWIDIGVFGDQELKGSSQGKLLSLERHHIDHADETFTVVVGEEPRKAGIDPLNKLIDRNPENNVTNVTAGAAPATTTVVKTSG